MSSRSSGTNFGGSSNTRGRLAPWKVGAGASHGTAASPVSLSRRISVGRSQAPRRATASVRGLGTSLRQRLSTSRSGIRRATLTPSSATSRTGSATLSRGSFSRTNSPGFSRGTSRASLTPWSAARTLRSANLSRSAIGRSGSPRLSSSRTSGPGFARSTKGKRLGGTASAAARRLERASARGSSFANGGSRSAAVPSARDSSDRNRKGKHGDHHRHGNRHGHRHGHRHGSVFVGVSFGWGWGCSWGWGWGGWGSPGWAYVGYPYYPYYYPYRYRYAGYYPAYYAGPYYYPYVYVPYPYGSAYVAYPVTRPIETVHYESDGYTAEADGEPKRKIIRPPQEGVAPPKDEASAGGAREHFAAGMLSFELGNYEEAGDRFYQASLDAPNNRMNRLMLGISLFGFGEYAYSAEYLRSSIDGWDSFLLYDWDLKKLYKREAELEQLKKTLDVAVQEDPSNEDVRFVQGFVRFYSGDLDGAVVSFEALSDIQGAESLGHSITRRYQRALAMRRGESIDTRELTGSMEVPVLDPAEARFLADPSVSSCSELSW